MVISGILALKFITENPCVTGSIPVGTTGNQRVAEMQLSFFVSLARLAAGRGRRGLNRELNRGECKKKWQVGMLRIIWARWYFFAYGLEWGVGGSTAGGRRSQGTGSWIVEYGGWRQVYCHSAEMTQRFRQFFVSNFCIEAKNAYCIEDR